MKKRIVVTGATGQLGSEIKSIWPSDSAYELIFLGREELPLDDVEMIYARLRKYDPDVIIHAGAYTAVDLAESETDMADRVNNQASREIAKVAKECSAKLLYISTDYVFPGDVSLSLTEDQDTDPINAYGLSKLQGEQGIQAILPDSIIIRTSWVYSSFGKNFVKTMLNLMASRKSINVVNDQIGSPTYAKDLAKAIQHIIKSDNWQAGIYHYSNEGEASWFDFANKIKEFSGLACEVIPVDSNAFPTVAKRPKYSLLNKEKIKKTFQLEIPHWEVSLKEMWGGL
ncbi:dTDP-4-dehydrorhamnose reductase [Sphingobacterium sp. PU5-4]|uniref:dTDP-4-dehydrorhamnose reductase n=1 Tax=Sphingobacterium tenebrionis TaxID=3111775 RepID=A0ABU8I1R5_9SPHI